MVWSADRVAVATSLFCHRLKLWRGVHVIESTKQLLETQWLSRLGACGQLVPAWDFMLLTLFSRDSLCVHRAGNLPALLKGLTLVHVGAELEQLQDTFMS